MLKSTKTTKEIRHEIYDFIEKEIGEIKENIKGPLSQRLRELLFVGNIERSETINLLQLQTIELKNKLAKLDSSSKYSKENSIKERKRQERAEIYKEKQIQNIKEKEKKEKDKEIMEKLKNKSFLP